jgi:hypothetical protein
MALINGNRSVRLSESGTEILIEGPPYLEILASLHGRFRPRTYFEVGTWKGASLRVANCASLAVDAEFLLEEGVLGLKPMCAFHQTTSDAFFASFDPSIILGGPIDLAFLDAFHVFEYVLRDFIGTERSCRPTSIIVLDDCCPRDLFMARRDLVPSHAEPTKYQGFWTGDVWKMIPVLREFRPDIQLTCIDTQPTGLATCTGLDPANRILVANYEAIVSTWRDVTLEEYGMSRLLDDLQMTSAESWVGSIRPLYPDDPIPPEDTRPIGLTLRDELRVVSEELDAIRASKSWRLTQPLRSISGLLRGVLGSSHR